MAAGTRHRAAAAVTALLLAACAGPQPPDWQLNAAGALRSFERLYLNGSVAAAEAEFRRARSEVARTGRAHLIARAELARCAVRAASLEFDDCPGFRALRDVAGPEELAYAEYLLGQGGHAAGEEPLSRLVAAAVQARRGPIPPATIEGAVETASSQGWRKALLAWLALQARRAEEAGDHGGAARVRRRIELIGAN